MVYLNAGYPMKAHNFRMTQTDMERLDRVVESFNKEAKKGWWRDRHNRSTVLRQLIENECMKLDAIEATEKEKLLKTKPRKRKVVK